MDWNNIRCPNCGALNEYTISQKTNQNVCICSSCNIFLGNKPKNENEIDISVIKIPFGKYKGELVVNITDLNYLKWMKENCKLSSGLLKAINYKLL